MERASMDEIRSFHAKLMADASRSYSRSHDQRLERIFELVPREAFFPPGPWKIQLRGSTNYLETPSEDPAYLYQNTLVALDADKHVEATFVRPELQPAAFSAASTRARHFTSTSTCRVRRTDFIQWKQPTTRCGAGGRRRLPLGWIARRLSAGQN